MSAGFNRDAVIEQHWDFVAEFVAALGIGDSDARAVGFHEQGRGDSGFTETDYQSAFSVQFHLTLFHHRVTEARRKQNLWPRIITDLHGSTNTEK
jgi:hypothetical protein